MNWIVYRSAVAAALYFGIVEQVEWVQYAFTSFVCWMLLVSVSECLELIAPRVEPPAVPRGCALAFDLSVLASTFLAHWYWTACAYAAYCGCIELLQARATSRL